LHGRCICANETARKLFSNYKGFEKLKAETYLKELLTNLNGDNSSFTKGNDTFEVDGETLFYEVIYQKEFDKKGIDIGTCIHLIDKSSEQQRLIKERYSATHDELTGMLNRNGFFEAVDQELALSGSENRIMVCSNICDFKLLNEMFGEETGDKILIRQAQILKEYSHPSSIYGRISDDRFALFVKTENYNESRLKLFMNQLIHIAESSVYKMHFNIGVYQVPAGVVESAQEMYNKSLLAIDSISGDYSVTFAHYDSLVMEKLLYKQHLTKDFENAVAQGQVKMFLQPIMDLNNKQVGAEVLCRWKHPQRGMLLPEAFLDVLEEAGLIYELDEYIWEQAAKTLQKWNNLGIKDCYISVNVSYKDFYYSDIYKTFSRLVEKYDIEPSSLHIEITETVLMGDFKRAFDLSEKLQKFGFNVAIDNFGNGYSSFSMLKDFKPTVLKLDRQLLENAPEDKRSQTILEAIVGMGKALGIVVIGEGVETKEQLEIMKKLGCNAYQGNYISEPLNEELYSERYIKN
ncbi:MAG: bifunctional diguanylate cyclase/phosphodiesterase, partial [Treponema sp.]|nr:bifunctional diguanylate cyclase/phosphodiesterase [Treponema sp.]